MITVLITACQCLPGRTRTIAAAPMDPIKSSRIALLLVALACAQAWGQAPRSALPQRELSPSQVLGELRRGGYVLYFRHAATDFSQNDEKMKRFEDCADQRNLIDQGRADARAAGAAIRQLGIPVERVLASPFCRTVETAQLLFGRAEKMQEVRGGPAVSATSERYAELRNILATPAAPVHPIWPRARSP